jgi:uncharacterized protein (DUF2147 family)
LQGTALDPRQLRRTVAAALLGIALAGSAAAAGASDGLEGHWENPKHSMVVNVSRCEDGRDYCAIVIKASAKAQANAAKGGTTHFIGTEILRVRPSGDGTFKGTAFDPESNMHVDATVTMAAPGVMDLKGCALLGLVCETQRWTKVSRD